MVAMVSSLSGRPGAKGGEVRLALQVLYNAGRRIEEDYAYGQQLSSNDERGRLRWRALNGVIRSAVKKDDCF